MLRHLDEIQAAKRVEDALFKVYREGKSLTRDVGGTASTTEFTDNLISTMGL
jgi:isocitrate dehydrogenase (NAD+)